MARKPMPMGPSPGLGLMQKAANSLAKSEHAVFMANRFQVKDQSGNDVPPNWKGEAVTHVTVHEPNNVTRVWRAHFWPNKFHVFMDADMTREAAREAAENLMELVNMRRKEGP